MKSKRMWDVAAMFIIVLVISLPIYSANVLAISVQITKNYGEDKIPGYLDAEGDTWTVEATISGTGASNATVAPEQVKIKIGNNEAKFNSCTNSPAGTVCEYVSPLSDGVQEKETVFRVEYLYSNTADPSGNSDVIRADGSAPSISALTAKQEGSDVILDFTASDKFSGKPGVGIKLIEIIDADNNEMLQSIPFSAPGVMDYSYASGGFENKLQKRLEGEGTRRIKVRAGDWLGHSNTGFAQAFKTDFVKPIIGDSLDLTVGDFIGSTNVYSDVTVQIYDNNVLESVKAYSEQASLDGEDAADSCVEWEEGGIWNCTWPRVEISPVSSVAIKIIAEDQYGNTAEKTLSQSFTADSSAPKVEFFGPERTFEGIGYIHSDDTKIYLRVNEQGAGMNIEGVRANLGAVGGNDIPTFCNQTASTFNCYWEVRPELASDAARISITRLQDLVGNEGQMPEVELVVDDAGPKIDKFELYGVDDAAKKKYFQSNDRIGIDITVFEKSGLFVLVDLNDLVMDAEGKFPANYVMEGLPEEGGWQVFSQDDEGCEAVEEGKWKCSLETEPIRSGPDNSVDLEIRITDTAGNEAVSWEEQAKNAECNKGDCRIDILGLDTEENPDYWEIARNYPKPQKGFVDLDTVNLGLTNMPFTVKLNTLNGRAKALKIELAGCVAANAQAIGTEQTGSPVPELAPELAAENPLVGSAAASAVAEAVPELSRSLFYGGNFPDGESVPSSTLVLEFVPFDGKKLFGISKEMEQFDSVSAEYVCQLIIYSKVGNNAIQAAEVEEITVQVPFAFSELGALDENLGEKIEEAKDEVRGAWEVLGVLNDVLKWVDYASQLYGIVLGVISVVNVASKPMDSFGALPGGQSLSTGACFGVSTFSSATAEGFTWLNDIIQFLSCRPDPGLGWYGRWQNSILDLYNVEIGRGLDSSCVDQEGNPLEACEFRPARNIKDNLFLSVLGLCVPGIIKNLDEFRQIKCRKIVCLEQEVPANKATVGTCDELESLLVCKYVVGELFYLVPFSQLWDQVVGFIESAIKDPIAIAHTLTIASCGLSCSLAEGPNTLNSFCTHAYFIWEIIDLVEQVTGFITTVYQDIDSGGLQYCDMVDY